MNNVSMFNDSEFFQPFSVWWCLLPKIILGKKMYIYIYIYIYICLWMLSVNCSPLVIACWEFIKVILTQPLCHKQDATLVLNSEFSFSKTSNHTKVEESTLPYYLPTAVHKLVGVISFPRVLALCVMQTTTTRIWIQVTKSYKDNRYIMSASLNQQVYKWIVYEVELNIWNHITVWKLFVSDRNTWYHATVCQKKKKTLETTIQKI